MGGTGIELVRVVRDAGIDFVVFGSSGYDRHQERSCKD